MKLGEVGDSRLVRVTYICGEMICPVSMSLVTTIELFLISSHAMQHKASIFYFSWDVTYDTVIVTLDLEKDYDLDCMEPMWQIEKSLLPCTSNSLQRNAAIIKIAHFP